MRPSGLQHNITPLRLVVLVSGEGTNLQAVIDAQAMGQIQSRIVCVISNKNNIKALERAQSAGIPSLVVASKNKQGVQFQKELLSVVKAQKPDLIVLAGFMKILGTDFVSHFRNKIINIHPALLPSFPGLNAIQQALDAGVNKTGCTVHFVDEGCDTGPIILQKEVAIDPNDTEESLAQKIHKEEHILLVKAIQKVEASSQRIAD